jgi:hypothetical protein
MKKPARVGVANATRDPLDEAELRRIAAELGGHKGHFRRMRLVPDEASPTPPSQRPHIAPRAPIKMPRRRWRDSELAAVIGGSAAAVVALGVALFGVLRRRRSAAPASPPARRADSVPARKPS